MFSVPAKAEVVSELEAAGVDEVLFGLKTVPEDETHRILDRFAGLLPGA